MGALPSVIRAEATKQSDEVEKTTNDALNSLLDLAKLRTELFRVQVKDTSDTTNIHISKIMEHATIIKCSVDYDATKISKHVTKVYDSIANKEFADAIGQVLSTGLEALFGSSVANSNEHSRYFVAVGTMGYPYRVDLNLYTYSFTSKVLTGVTKNVLAVSYYLSSVDLAGCSNSDIATLVQKCYGRTDKKIFQEIVDNLTKVRDTQLEEKKGKSSTPSGENKKAAFRGDGQGLKPGNRLLDFDVAGKELHNAWKDAMEKEEAIPSYQLPEGSETLRSLLDKLD